MRHKPPGNKNEEGNFNFALFYSSRSSHIKQIILNFSLERTRRLYNPNGYFRDIEGGKWGSQPPESLPLLSPLVPNENRDVCIRLVRLKKIQVK